MQELKNPTPEQVNELLNVLRGFAVKYGLDPLELATTLIPVPLLVLLSQTKDGAELEVFDAFEQVYRQRIDQIFEDENRQGFVKIFARKAERLKKAQAILTEAALDLAETNTSEKRRKEICDEIEEALKRAMKGDAA